MCCRSCYPTFSSNNVFPHTREMLRPLLCRKYGNINDEIFDIGIYNNQSPCKENTNFTFCQQCAECGAKPGLSPTEQARFKYQLIVDGHGAANEATIWKLLSKSVSVQIRPDDWNFPIFEQFYHPLLKPYQHFIPATLSELPAAIAWCEEHDELCQALGVSAHNVIKCLLHRDVLEEYVFGLLEYVHNSTLAH